MAAASIGNALSGPAPLDWLYDLAISVASPAGEATLAARSADLFPLAAAVGLGLDEILGLAPDMAALAIEHALSPVLDVLERRLGERLAVTGLARPSGLRGDFIEREIAIGERQLRFAIERDNGRIVRAFQRFGEPAPLADAQRPPRGAVRLVVGPLDLPDGAVQALLSGDALGFEPADLPAAMMAEDGALWATLRFQRGGFRLASKGRTVPAPGAWIELDGAAPAPETLLVGDAVAVDPGRARLLTPHARIEGRLVEIDGRFGFQAATEGALS